MKKFDLIDGVAAAVALVAVIAIASCERQSPTDPSNQRIDQNQTTNVNIGPQASPSAGVCLAVDKVVISAPAGIVHGGTPVQLGFTSFALVGGVEQARARSCDQASTENWSATPPCSIDRPQGLNPNLTASAAGSCAVVIDVDGVSDSAVVAVN